MIPFISFDAFGFLPVPWSVPHFGSGVSKSGKVFRFSRRGKKSRLAEGALSLEDWQKYVRGAAEDCMRRAKTEVTPWPAVMLEIEFYLPTAPGHRAGEIVIAPVDRNKKGGWKKSTNLADLTNLVKAVEDAIEGVVYCNDVQVRSALYVTLYGPVPGARVTVRLIEPNDFPGCGDFVPIEIPPPKSRRSRPCEEKRSRNPTRSLTPSAEKSSRSRRKKQPEQRQIKESSRSGGSSASKS